MPEDTAPRTQHSEAAEPGPPPHRDPVRRWTLVVAAICVALFVWSVIADRLTPFSSSASLRAFVIRVAPEVSGRVVEVAIEENRRVEAGQLLFRIDPTPFNIAVEAAEAQLAAAGQAVGASTAGVDAAQAEVVQQMAELQNTREQTERIFELMRRGVYPEARGDQARSQLDTAQAQLDRAKASLEQARQALGPEGSDNPQIRAALAQLEQARLDLTRTSVWAPTEGVVVNLQLDIGQCAAAGQPALTFIDARAVWLLAPMRENSLGNLHAGARAEVVLDGLPGRVLPARVVSVGWGISEVQADPATGLPVSESGTELLPTARRFPVRLELEERPHGFIRHGGRGDVIIYTGENLLMNALAWVWVRAVALFSYVY
jgi:multidrug resistance efflux pump